MSKSMARKIASCICAAALAFSTVAVAPATQAITTKESGTAHAANAKAPAKAKLISLASPKKCTLTLNAAKIDQATSYQFQISRNVTMTSKTATTGLVDNANLRVSGLSEGKTYYVRVRAYSSKTDLFGEWSSVRKAVVTRKKGNIDKFIGLDGNVLVLGCAKKSAKVYKTASRKKSLGRKYTVGSRSCVVIDKSYLNSLQKGIKHKWLMISLSAADADLKAYQDNKLMKRIGQTYAWINVADFTLDTLNTTTFGMKSLTGKNATRAAAAKFAVDHLGSPYHDGWDSLEKGLDCASFALLPLYEMGVLTLEQRFWPSKEACKHGKKVKRSKLKPGDIVFYRRKGAKVATHTTIYIGKGYVAHCSGPASGRYPHSGSRISRIDFRSLEGQYLSRSFI